MRILVYVEPRLAGGRQRDYKQVVRSFLHMLGESRADKVEGCEAQVEVKVLMPRPYRWMLREFPSLIGRVIFAIEAETSDGRSAAPRHYSVSPVACGRVLNQIKRSLFDFDVLVHWGSDARIRQFAEAAGISCVSMGKRFTAEWVYDSVHFDSCGTADRAITHSVDLGQIDPLSGGVAKPVADNAIARDVRCA